MGDSADISLAAAGLPNPAIAKADASSQRHRGVEHHEKDGLAAMPPTRPLTCRKDSYRKQIIEHCSDLEQRSELISREINSKVGGLVQQQSEIDIERQKLLAVLEE